MAAKPVEWVLVVYYGPSAHRATYGRLDNTKYTKDYIQLSKKADFLEAVKRLFPVAAGATGSVPLTYRWPTGSTSGEIVFNSADRPHLKWQTNLGAPKAWKMSLKPADAAAETIPGDPDHLDFEAAENELAMLASRGAGQPYLMAIKLQGEATTLHLRVYLDGPKKAYQWANLNLVPTPIQELAFSTSRSSALAWGTYASGGVLPSEEVARLLSEMEASGNPESIIAGKSASIAHGLAAYLRNPGYGLFFDARKNHDAWTEPAALSEKLALHTSRLVYLLSAMHPPPGQGDAAAENADDIDQSEVESFVEQIAQESYSVPDSLATTKTRGSAQRAFADAVTSNYGYRCAITGISTREFLIASHIVPWSEDQSIRLDPSNGICLSLIMDRAFEKGQLLVEDDLTIKIGWKKVSNDSALKSLLAPYDGKRLTKPKGHSPKPEYLKRRRGLVSAKD